MTGKTYIITAENGEVTYIGASSARAARAKFSRTRNEKIVSCKLAKPFQE